MYRPLHSWKLLPPSRMCSDLMPLFSVFIFFGLARPGIAQAVHRKLELSLSIALLDNEKPDHLGRTMVARRN